MMTGESKTVQRQFLPAVDDLVDFTYWEGARKGIRDGALVAALDALGV